MAKHDIDLIVAQLDSWKTGYLAPSAQILMDEARTLIIEQARQIEALLADNAALAEKTVDTVKKGRRHPERSYTDEAIEKAADIAFKQWHKWPADEIKAAILELKTSK